MLIIGLFMASYAGFISSFTFRGKCFSYAGFSCRDGIGSLISSYTVCVKQIDHY